MPIHGTKEEGHLPYPYGDASVDEETRTEVLNALHWNSGVPQDRVHVDVSDGRVVLTGRVLRDYERDLAQKHAETAPGVTEVVNDIEIEH